jgi:sugar phosphate permease
MAVSGFLFISWRIFQIVLLVPVVGMLSWFVHGYVQSNQLTPNFILVLFIVSVLALAWVFATLFNYLRARHDAIFVALIDLGFVGALIGGIVTLRGIAKADCSNFSAGSLYVNLGPFGYYGRQSNSPWSVNINKTCAMLKASWALAIILTLTFFVTFVSSIERAHFAILLLTLSLTASRPPRSSQPQERRQGRSQARIPHFASRPPSLRQPQPWSQPFTPH